MENTIAENEFASIWYLGPFAISVSNLYQSLQKNENWELDICNWEIWIFYIVDF